MSRLGNYVFCLNYYYVSAKFPVTFFGGVVFSYGLIWFLFCSNFNVVGGGGVGVVVVVAVVDGLV